MNTAIRKRTTRILKPWLLQGGLLIAALFLASEPVLAAANLMVTPSRVVFEERTRSAQVTLMNTGTESGSFRISFIRQQMTETGEFVAVTPGEDGQFSDPMIRFSPRQITLPPGQSQVVRLMLRKPRDLDEGEYRSHMLFQSIPQPSKSSIESAINTQQEGISVEIIPVLGVSIPVIVREGRLESELSLGSARLIPASEANPVNSIEVELHRTGSKSVYGDFRAIYRPADGGPESVIALANGVAVYTPNSLRRFAIPVNLPVGARLEGGSIRILFLESGKDEASGLIAETQLSL